MRDDCQPKTYRSVKNTSLYHCMTWVLFFGYSKPKIKCIHSSSHTELTLTKHDCISAQCNFKWNRLVTVHGQRTVGFPHLQTLPRTNANSLVSIIMWLYGSKVKVIPQQAEVAQGVPGRLRAGIFLTFGTTRVTSRQPYAPAAFTPGEITFRG